VPPKWPPKAKQDGASVVGTLIARANIDFFLGVQPAKPERVLTGQAAHNFQHFEKGV